MRWFRIAFVVGLSVILLAAVLTFRRIATGQTEIGYLDERARVSVRTLRFSTEKGELVLGDLSGRVVLIDVWASWCSPCIAGIPKLVELQESYGGKVEVLGLNVDEGGWEAVEGFLSRHPSINFRIARPQPEPSLLLPTVVDLEPLGKVSALPTSFLVDAEGRLVSKYVGAEHYEQIEQDIVRLLEEGAS